MKSTGARRSTESTFSFTGCLEGAACDGVLQVSMLDDKLMVEVGLRKGGGEEWENTQDVVFVMYSGGHC